MATVKQARIAVLTESDLLVLAIQTALNAPHNVTKLNNLDDLKQPPLPELLFLDDTVCLQHNIENLLQYLNDQYSTLKIVLLTSHCNGMKIRKALQYRVSGYLCLCDSLAANLQHTVQDVMRHIVHLSPSAAHALAEAQEVVDEIGPHLTDYHREVLQMMYCKLSPSQIAHHLGKSRHAVHQVQSYLRLRFNVETNEQMLRQAVDLGIVRQGKTDF